MGHTLSSSWARCFGKAERRVLITGLDAAGKTTILYKLKLGEVVTTIPTIGFNVETVEYGQGMSLLSFTIWDIGGRGKIRALRRHYYQNCQAIIFVVDSNDRDRVEDAAEELNMLLREDELRDAVLLVFANKHELPNAMTVQELNEKLMLHRLRGRQWFMQQSCALTGNGLYEGLDWLHSVLQHRKTKVQNSSQPEGLIVRQPNTKGSSEARMQKGSESVGLLVKQLDDKGYPELLRDTESTADTDSLQEYDLHAEVFV